jgi:hypothetical protein
MANSSLIRQMHPWPEELKFSPLSSPKCNIFVIYFISQTQHNKPV